MKAVHTPVLLEEVIGLFSPKPGNSLVDVTLGHGGHTATYLSETAPDGEVVGLDADPEAIAVAKDRLKEFKDRVTYINSNFAYLKEAINGGGDKPSKKYTHILFDLGLGSHQIADTDRGFSFTSGKGLSMLYGDRPLPPSSLQYLNWLEQKLQRLPDVSDILDRLRQEDLSHLIRTYGEERFSGRIARVIKENAHKVATAQDLAEVISSSVPSQYRHGRIHPATRTFQALRLAVNRELESLQTALPQALDLLEQDGKIAVISFHSLEDRLVKQFFKQQAGKDIGALKILTKKPVTASEEEVEKNPRSRSAKLRVAQKT